MIKETTNKLFHSNFTGRPIHKAGHPDYVPNKKLWCEIEGRYFSVDHSFGESREETSLKSKLDKHSKNLSQQVLILHLRMQKIMIQCAVYDYIELGKVA